MSNFKKAIDHKGEDLFSRAQKNRQGKAAQAAATGVGGDKLEEPVPKHNQASHEKVIEGENNAAIVIGRDRPGDLLSGYGGKGDTQAGSIDLAVDRDWET